MNKDPFVSEHHKDPVDWVHTNQFRVKCERPITVWDPSDDEDNVPENFASNPDTKFKFPKENKFDEVRYVNHICEMCDKVLRDGQELRNHLSNHHLGDLSLFEVSRKKILK